MTMRLLPAHFVVVAVLTASGLVVSGQTPPRTPVAPSSALHVLPIRGNVFLLAGAGANITVSVGSDGVLLVDAGDAAMADQVIATVAQLARAVTASPGPVRLCPGVGCAGVTYPALLGTIASPAPPKPIQFIVNTNADPDHTGGNAKVAQAGPPWRARPGRALSRKAPWSMRTRTSRAIDGREGADQGLQ